MADNFRIDNDFVTAQNAPHEATLEEDFAYLGKKLDRQGVDIESVVTAVQGLEVAVPSWGAGTGGTRFARFPGIGEPRGVFRKIGRLWHHSPIGPQHPKGFAAHSLGQA